MLKHRTHYNGCAWRVICALAGACLSVNCTARVVATTPAVVTDEEVAEVPAPPEVYTYPHRVYEGRVVYLVGDRWYYSTGPRWYSYRREPVELAHHRERVQQARPAYSRRPVRQRDYVEQAPPARAPREAVRVD